MPVCGMTCDVMERSAKKRISSFVHADTDEIHIQFIFNSYLPETFATQLRQNDISAGAMRAVISRPSPNSSRSSFFS